MRSCRRSSGRRHRRADQPLERAPVALYRDLDAQVLEAAGHQAAAIMPVTKYWLNVHPGRDRRAEDRAEDDQNMRGKAKVKIDRLPAAEELGQLQPAPAQRPAGPAPAAGRAATAPRPPRRMDVISVRSSAGRRPPAWGGSRSARAPRRRSRATSSAPARPDSRLRPAAVRPDRRQPTVAAASAAAAQRGRGGDLDQPAAGDHADPVGQRLGLVQVVGGEQDRGPGARPGRGSAPRTRRRASGSNPVVGSSRNSSSGRPMMPRATSSRRRWPPESFGCAPALSASPTRSITSSGSSGSRVVAREVADHLADRQLARTRRRRCSTMPIRARQSGVGLAPGRRPARLTSPASALPVTLQDLHRGRLPGPVRAEQGEHLAPPYRQIERVDRHGVAVRPAQAGRYYRLSAHGVHRAARAGRWRPRTGRHRRTSTGGPAAPRRRGSTSPKQSTMDR